MNCILSTTSTLGWPMSVKRKKKQYQDRRKQLSNELVEHALSRSQTQAVNPRLPPYLRVIGDGATSERICQQKPKPRPSKEQAPTAWTDICTSILIYSVQIVYNNVQLFILREVAQVSSNLRRIIDDWKAVIDDQVAKKDRLTITVRRIALKKSLHSLHDGEKSVVNERV